MNLITRFMGRSRRKGLVDTVGLAWCIATGMLDYWLNPFAKKQSHTPKPGYEKIRRDMEQIGLDVISYRVDVEKFCGWLEDACFPQAYVSSYKDLFVEKALEHYLGAELLDLEPDDVLIDVAAAHSPWFEIAERMYECKAYALDLAFPRGINGKRIGADATGMPISDGVATKIALHCAYETFEGDADIRLLPEVSRVLAKKGRMVILPLYMHDFYFADTGPMADRRGIDYQGARRVWRENGKTLRFSRKYSVAAFKERVISHLGDLSLRIFYVENVTAVSPGCYCKFVALFEK